MSTKDDIATSKQELRDRLRSIRRKQENKDELSARIFQRLDESGILQAKNQVLFYIHVRDEVRTQFVILARLATGGECVVPYCLDRDLQLCRIVNFRELERGKYGILEPSLEVRSDPARKVEPTEIDVALIPGLGFSERGQRIGYGAGYYDRLLATLRKDCLKIGLAFDCQIVAHIPTDAHDVSVDWVVTESRMIDCDPIRK